MPKDVLEIKAFESGNIYNADDRDIPDDAAVYSENIDPYGQSGSLMSIQGDTAIKTGVDTTRMAIINDNETYRLVYVDKSDYDIKKIDDLHGTPSSATVVKAGTFGTSSSISALQTNNKEVHMGLGKTIDPQWTGIIPHAQFGGSAPSGLQSETAELTAPSPFPNMHSIVNDATNTYAYGIQQNGKYVYKFDVSTGVLAKRSEYFFSETEAICLASDNSLWVADIANSNFTIIKVDLDNMDVITSRVVTGTTGVTDIMEVGNVLWLARGNVDSATILYSVSVSSLATNSSSIAATNRSPYAGTDSTGTANAGDWLKYDGFNTSTPGQSQFCTISYGTPKLPLVRLTGSTDYIGIVTRVVPTESTSSWANWHYGDVSTEHIGWNGDASIQTNTSNVNAKILWYLLVVKNNITAGDKLSSLANKGKVYAFSYEFQSGYADAYLTKQDTNTNYLNWVEKGSSASQSSLYRLGKVAYNHTQTTIVGGLRNPIGTNLDINDAILDETNNAYNVFSSAGQVRWASGPSGSLAKKAEGEIELSFTVNNGVESTLNTTHHHFYATSFVYDGYQESPLSAWILRENTNNGTAGLNVKIDLYATNMSKRITHINVYRSSPGNGNATQPVGFFRLIRTVSVKSGWLITNSNTTNPNWGDYYSKTIVDNGASYSSYEARTGISEALTNTLPKYSLSAKVNNFLYITGCSHPDIDDATNYLFKSRPFNFDQYNIARDYLLLPNTATAMESFNGRLYVFSTNEIYVINPDGMYIEDTLKGVGCKNQNTVISSEIGLCWIDKNSIYYHDGRNINDIGAKIKKAHQLDDVRNDYSALDNLCEFNSTNYGGDIVLGYDGYRKSFCFFYQYKYDTVTTFQQTGCSYSGASESVNHPVNSNIVQGLLVSGPDIPANSYIIDIVSDNNSRFELNNQPTGSQPNSTLTFTNTVTTYIPQCLVYTVPKNRWDVWNRPYTSNLLTLSAINGKNNELIVSDSINGLIKPFDPKSATRLDNFIWYSKKFTMGESTSDKRIYKAEILSEDSTPTITVNTDENSSSYTALTTKRTARHAQVKLSVTGDTTATIDALRLVFRRLKRTKAMS